MSAAVRTSLLFLALLCVAAPAAEAADIFALGSQARLTQVGPNGDNLVDANNPAVAYNSRDDEYLLVWSGNTVSSAEHEVLGRVLDGAGNPKGPVQFLSSVPNDEVAPVDPVVGYSSAINQYVIGYIATPEVLGGSPTNSPPGQREVIVQVVTTTGARSGAPARLSNTDSANVDADAVSDLAMAYDSEHDLFRFVWSSDADTEGDFEVRTQAVLSNFVNPDGLTEQPVSATGPGDAFEPAVAYLPAQNRWAIAWQAATGSGTEIFASVIGLVGGTIAAPGQISSAGNTGTMPSIAVNTTRNEFLVAFVRNNLGTDGAEAFVQRLSSDRAQLPNATDQRISTMGPDNNIAYDVSTTQPTTATYHSMLDRYLVTWASENDLVGMVDGEIERYGQALNGEGAEVPTDDFRLSVSGNDGSTASTPSDAATIAVPSRRAWFHVWSADDNRPPLADGEFEIYGRFAGDDGDLDGFPAPGDCDDANAAVHPGAVDILDNGVDEDCTGTFAENLDRDADGSQRPADCDDGNANVRPGAADAPDNGVDEDCNGADAINLDRDGDGAARPGDCNDGNPAIRPGAKDIARNGVDEDCVGGDASLQTLTSGVLPTWDVKGSRLTLVNLQITQQFPKGLKVKITCKGSKCPFKSKALKLGKVRRNAAPAISSLSKKQRKFRAGQTIEVWVSAPGFNSKISRLVLKARKIPVSQPFCALPGTSKVQKRCT
jgi:hypothetical protein